MRASLGLSRAELSLLLGVGLAQVGHVETGYRDYSHPAQARPRGLAALLPLAPVAAAESVPPATPAVPPPPPPGEAATLRKQLRACYRAVRQLQAQQKAFAERKAALVQRHQILAALGRALAATPSDPTEPGLDTAREAEWLTLLETGTTRLARRQPTPTAQALLALRLRLLTEEAAALEALLLHGPQ